MLHIPTSTLGPTSTIGGAIDQTAVIGHAPEHRDWDPNEGYMPVWVDKTARIEAFVTIDCGTSRNTFIGARVWLMKHVHVGHDAIVNAGSEIAPGTVLCGHAVIGQDVRIGVNASVLPGVRVGDGARIGAGAVVTKNVPAGEVWVGNPARRLPT